MWVAHEQANHSTPGCPPWCIGEHSSRSPIEHTSAAVAVPVIALLTTNADGDLVRQSEAAEFEVGLTRRDDEPDTWLYIGAGSGQEIQITTESAQRLLYHVATQLDALEQENLERGAEAPAASEEGASP